MTFARFATVAVPLPPREPAAGNAPLPSARLGAVTGRDTALMPLYPAGRRPDDRATALLPVCGDEPDAPAADARKPVTPARSAAGPGLPKVADPA